MTIHIVIPDDYQFATQKLDFLHSNNNFHCTALHWAISAETRWQMKSCHRLNH